MIIIKLKGGLGNQLFQYALGRNISSSTNKEVKFDLSWFKHFPQRQYKLDNFNTKVDVANFFETIGIKKFKRKDGRRFLILNLFKRHQSVHITEKEYNFQPQIFQLNKNSYLEGSWQSYKYFKDIKNTIREELTIKEKTSEPFDKIMKKTKEVNSVSLHVRRGDYTTEKVQQVLKLCSLNYYRKAISVIKEKINNPTFFIFSDDIEWVKKNLKTNSPTVFVSDYKIEDYEELLLMSMCKHNIIANSSFSWWGAWLNNNPHKIVIAPKKWFNDENIKTKDLISKDWVQL